jgi:hypothetical protein
MAVVTAGNLDPNKSIKSKGLYDAAAMGGMSYEDWSKLTPDEPNKAMPTIAPSQVDDTVASQVTKLAAADSKLNQMARTEGLKAANRRGLLNSSMAVGASQDAVLQNILPIAQQDAAQAYGKNQAARAFEYGMTAQEAQQKFQTGERLGTEKFQSKEAVAERGWQTAENIAQRGFLGTQADLDRDLAQTLQTQQIDAANEQQIRQIASTEGIEAANRALQQVLQENDINFRMSEGKLDRASAEKMQQADIAYRQSEANLDRNLQTTIAKWNLAASDRAAAADMLTSMETMYQSSYQSIMANTNLDSTSRADYLTAAKNLRNTQLNLVEQMYNVDLNW